MPSVRLDGERPRSPSPTVIALYERCPRRFAFRYLTDAYDGGPTLPLTIGACVHGALAELLRVPEQEREPGLGRAVLLQRWSQLSADVFADDTERETGFRCAARLVDSFCASAEYRARPLAIESWVGTRLSNGRLVSGRVDRIDSAGCGGIGIEIVDYKTGRRPGRFDVGSDTAARVYTLAAARTMRRPVTKVRYLWLATGHEDVWRPRPEELAGVDRELGRLVESMATDVKVPPTPSETCPRCPYKELCDAAFSGTLVLAPPR